jgi:hypothetical protein
VPTRDTRVSQGGSPSARGRFRNDREGTDAMRSLRSDDHSIDPRRDAPGDLSYWMVPYRVMFERDGGVLPERSLLLFIRAPGRLARRFRTGAG